MKNGFSRWHGTLAVTLWLLLAGCGGDGGTPGDGPGQLGLAQHAGCGAVPRRPLRRRRPHAQHDVGARRFLAEAESLLQASPAPPTVR
jgi:hypothetical protein